MTTHQNRQSREAFTVFVIDLSKYRNKPTIYDCLWVYCLMTLSAAQPVFVYCGTVETFMNRVLERIWHEPDVAKCQAVPGY